MKFALLSIVLIGCAGNGVAEPEYIDQPTSYPEAIYIGGNEMKASCHKDVFKVGDKSFEYTTCAIPTQMNEGLDDPIPYNANSKIFNPNIYIQPITSVERGQ